MASARDNRVFPVGEMVVLHFGATDLPAKVVEDRGNLGAHGGRVFRIEVSFGDDSNLSEFEVPASALDLATTS